MPEKSISKGKYDIDAALLQSFFINCDNVYVNYTEAIDYATQLYILVESYYETDRFDSEIILNCIEKTSKQLYQIICDVYDIMKVCANIHGDLVIRD